MQSLFTINSRVFMFLLGTLAFAVQAEELLKSSRSWDGGAIEYPSGEPEVTAVKLTIAAGETTPFHCHPVPTLGYILKGSVEVETNSGKTVALQEGQSVIEVMRTLHRGKALGGPVEILVFYAGAKELPNTVLSADDPHNAHCKD